MMVAILDCDMQLLPLELVLLKNNISSPKPQPILLSRFKSIDYDILDRLEGSRIYDTGDLELISDEQLQQIGFSSKDCINLRSEIKNESKKFSKLPQLLLDLPGNYGLIFYQFIDESLIVELFWKGLSYWWKVNNEKLENFLIEFLNFMQSVGLPELISITDKLPELDVLELPIFDISIYVGNIDFKQDTERLMKQLQLDKLNDQVFQFKETLALSYIIDLVQPK